MILLFAAQTLWAGTYRLGIAGGDSVYMGLVKDTLSTIGHVYSQEEIEKTRGRENEAFLKSEEARKEKALLNEDFSSYTTDKTFNWDIVSSLDLELVPVKLSGAVEEFVLSGDKDAIVYAKACDNLDALLLVESRDEGGFAFVRVMLDGETVRESWYVPALRESEGAWLLSFFASLYLGDEHHLHTVSVEPTSASLLDNGEIMETTGSVVLTDGTHVFTLSAYGYEDKEVVMDLSSGEDLRFTLDRAEPKTLYVQAFPWDAEISLNGEKKSGSTIDGVFTPFTLSMKHDDFSFLSYQSTQERSSVSLSMRPAWMDGVDFVKEKKDDFYASLFTTLMSYGGFVAARALNNFSDLQVKPLMVVLGGVSIVSLVNLVQSAADYFNAASLGL